MEKSAAGSAILPEVWFKEIDEIIVHDYGERLAQIAEREPRLAYEAWIHGMVTHGLQAACQPNVEVVRIYPDGETLSLKADSDGVEAVRLSYEKKKRYFDLPYLTEPHEVVIQTVKNKTVWDRIRKRLPKTQVALSFTIPAD